MLLPIYQGCTQYTRAPDENQNIHNKEREAPFFMKLSDKALRLISQNVLQPPEQAANRPHSDPDPGSGTPPTPRRPLHDLMQLNLRQARKKAPRAQVLPFPATRKP